MIGTLPPFPDDAEATRLAVLARYGILDTPPERGFDDITRLAAQVCQTPVALITLLDDRRQWFKARVGTDIAETPREHSFCRCALQQTEPLIIPDLRRDARFADNPFVQDEVGARFYAGVPLRVAEGVALGTLCVLDYAPRQLTASQIEALTLLSRQAVDQLEARRREAAGRQREARTSAILQGALDGFCLLDAQGGVRDVNDAYCRLVGYDRQELLARRLSDLEAVKTPAEVAAHMEQIRRSGPARFEAVHRARNGALIPLEVSANFLADADDPTGGMFCVFCRDIGERKQAEQALRESERQLQTITDNAPVFIARVDAQCRYVFVNRAYQDALNVPREAILGRTLSDVLGAPAFDRLRPYVERVLAGEAVTFDACLSFPDRAAVGERTVHASYVPERDAQGRVTGFLLSVMDITERVLLEWEHERLLHETERLLAEAVERADRDPLTGLLNHRAFQRRLEEECNRSLREGRPLGVAMMDLDNFRFFNDAHGHPVGDRALRRVAEALRRSCRTSDTLARFGGDEFALLMPGAGPADAERLARRLAGSLRHLNFRPTGYDTDVPLNLSVGAAVFPDEAPARADVIALADARLYRAKSGQEYQTEADRLRASVSRSVEGFSMLDALVTAVDNKDRYTRRHSEDVLAYSRLLARELGWGEAALHQVGLAALLHDVGKIGVPDAVLRKPGHLTDEEYQAVQQHPMMGAIIVGAVPGFEETLSAIRHHHERWDGGGYPFGLRGEETPLMARLMAVADAYSAMTTDRPYRKGMDPSRALAILKDGAGTQWDPQCVAAFLQARSRSVTARGAQNENVP